jgi:hypothetical protein
MKSCVFTKINSRFHSAFAPPNSTGSGAHAPAGCARASWPVLALMEKRVAENTDGRVVGIPVKVIYFDMQFGSLKSVWLHRWSESMTHSLAPTILESCVLHCVDFDGEPANRL